MANSYGMTVSLKTDENRTDIAVHGANLSVKQYCPGEPSEFFTLGAKNDSETVDFSVFLHRAALFALHAELTAMVDKLNAAAPKAQPAPTITPPTTLEPALL